MNSPRLAVMNRTEQLRLAVMNRKGGVGKTSLTSGIGSVAAKSGLRVLLIDLDPQANLTRRLLPEFPLNNTVLYDSLVHGAQLEPRPTRVTNLSLIPSGTNLRHLDRVLDPNAERFDLLANPINQWCKNWDLIILDGPPGEETMQAAAIGAAPWVVAPARADRDSIEALEDLAGLMVLQREQRPPPWANLMGVVGFAWKRSATARNRDVTKQITTKLQAFGHEVLFKHRIWEASTPAENMRERLLLPSDIPEDWTGPEGALARSYEELFEEILQRHERATT